MQIFLQWDLRSMCNIKTFWAPRYVWRQNVQGKVRLRSVSDFQGQACKILSAHFEPCWVICKAATVWSQNIFHNAPLHVRWGHFKLSILCISLYLSVFCDYMICLDRLQLKLLFSCHTVGSPHYSFILHGCRGKMAPIARRHWAKAGSRPSSWVAFLIFESWTCTVVDWWNYLLFFQCCCAVTSMCRAWACRQRQQLLTSPLGINTLKLAGADTTRPGPSDLTDLRHVNGQKCVT